MHVQPDEELRNNVKLCMPPRNFTAPTNYSVKIGPVHHILFIFIYLFLTVLGCCTLGLVLAKVVLYDVSHDPSPFLL
jgi:hypothetical protein